MPHTDAAAARTSPLRSLPRWLGVERDPGGLDELLLSSLGTAAAIGAIYLISHHLLGLSGAVLLVASMAASAVLLFAVPHGQLSQPWPILMGQLISAAVGVTCARLIGVQELAALVAVGAAVLAMRLLKALHPPGAATALIAVVGGDAVRDLGYRFVLEPVLLNSVILVAVGVLVLLPMPARRYPAHAARRARSAPAPDVGVSDDELAAAVREMDEFVDLSDDSLVELLRIVRRSSPRD
jgi:CBS-domain-containing membrane protein